MKKFILTVFAALMVLVMIVGCSQQPEATSEPEDVVVEDEPVVEDSEDEDETATEPVTIQWASWVFAEESQKPTYMAMVDSFVEEYPEITVELSAQPYAQYLDQLLVSAAGGNAPHVAHIKAEWLPQFLALGVVKDLSPYISPDILADYSESSINAMTVDGKLAAIPWFNNTYAIYYNKALLEQAGITELPTNWDELITAAYKVSELSTDDKKIYGLGIANSEIEAGEGYNTFPALWAHGGDFQDADGNINLTDDAAIETFTEIQNLFLDEVSPNGASFKDLRNLFGQGLLGFYWDIEATIGAAAESAPDQDKFYEDLGVMVIPTEDGPAGHGYLIDHILIAFEGTSEDEMDAVSKFIEHLSGEASIGQLYRDGKGKMSSRASVMEIVYGEVESDITKVYVEAMKTAYALPTSGLHFMDADEMLNNALTRLAQGEDVVEVMADLEERIQALYNE
jgi:multiple sugar transport system substrate-binding protein